MTGPAHNGRRTWLMGVAAALAGGALVRRAAAPSGATVPRTSGEPSGAADATRVSDTPATMANLIAPFEEGSSLLGWHIERILPVRGGAGSLVMRDEDGGAFQLDVCARDATGAGPSPPGHSARFDIFLSNGGAGTTASLERHGLAAMAIADVIRHNEAHLDPSAFLTLQQRLATSPDAVKRTV